MKPVSGYKVRKLEMALFSKTPSPYVSRGRAGATAGLGPVIWYFVSVDPIFRRIDKNPK